ncbi:hypothetical protein PQ610_04860 [Tardisphaera miroshnichenkoae]
MYDADAFRNAIKAFESELTRLSASKRRVPGYEICEELEFVEPMPAYDFDLAFCDGGNYTIFTSSYFIFQLNRVFASSWKGRKRTAYVSVDFLTLTRRTTEGFSSAVYPLKADSETPLVEVLPSEAETLVDYRELMGLDALTAASQLPRRIAEKKLAMTLIGKHVVVLDGLLQPECQAEWSAINELRSLSQVGGHLVAGLAKTAALLDPALVPAIVLEKEGEWYVRLAKVTSRGSDLYAAKFHRAALAPYFVEVVEGDKRLIEDLFNALFSDSLDPHLPGYPHGLIDADRNARVGMREAERLRGEILRMMQPKLAKDIMRGERTLGTHDLLNALNSI